MIPAARPFFDAEMREEVLTATSAVLRSGRMILGSYTDALEIAFAKAISVPFACAVSSGSAALEIALRWHLRECSRFILDRLVLVPANTFAAAAMVPLRLGCHVRFVDAADEERACDLGVMAQRARDEHAAAVIVVHHAGTIDPAFGDFVDDLHAHGIPVIEDCAHAHGAHLINMNVEHPAPDVQRRYAGSIGDVGCWSFYATKPMSGGTGGMITTRDPRLDAYARSMRHHGGSALDFITDIGGNDYLMSEITAAVVLTQVTRMEYLRVRRLEIAAWYAAEFASESRLHVPPFSHPVRAAYYKQPLYLREARWRDPLRTYLRDNDIETGVLYSPLAYEQPAVAEHALAARPDCSIARALVARQLCLPLYVGLTPAHIETITRCVKRGLDLVTGTATV